MLKKRLTSAVITLIALLSFGVSVQAECNKELKMGWSLPEPLGFLDATGNRIGFDIEILEAVVQRAGCTLSYYPESGQLPWARHLKMLEHGELDLLASGSWKADRAKYAFYSFPYRSEHLAIYVRRGIIDQIKVHSIEDLPNINFSLGARRGTAYGLRTDKVIQQLGPTVHWINNPEQFQNMLLKKRIDGYLSYLTEEPVRLKKGNKDSLIKAHPSLIVKTGSVHILLSKKSNSYATLEALNAALIEIQSDGTYDDLVKKYELLYGISRW